MSIGFRKDPVEYLKRNPFVLAPMAGITDCAFRSFMREMGAGVVVTELVSATGLKYSSQKTRDLMKFTESQRPIGIQLFGEDLGHLSEAAKEVEQLGADFVDLNFGCPVQKIVKKGAGAATLRDLNYLASVLRTVKSAVTIPVTIKIRTGWDQSTRNSVDVAHVASEEGITWIAIHGRTRAQAYTGFSDWEYIKEVKAASKIPILGNGDIQSGKQAISRLRESSCDGVLIGRGCLKNPWIFRDALTIYNEENEAKSQRNFMHALDSLRGHLVAHFDDRLASLQLKKFSAWFSTGYPGSANFRKKIFSATSLSEAHKICAEYFSEMTLQHQEDTSDKPFLMGGHG